MALTSEEPRVQGKGRRNVWKATVGTAEARPADSETGGVSVKQPSLERAKNTVVT